MGETIVKNFVFGDRELEADLSHYEGEFKEEIETGLRHVPWEYYLFDFLGNPLTEIKNDESSNKDYKVEKLSPGSWSTRYILFKDHFNYLFRADMFMHMKMSFHSKFDFIEHDIVFVDFFISKNNG